MRSKARDRRFTSKVGIDLEPVRVASGFLFTEGPAWHPIDHHLTFSDIPANRLFRWSATSGLNILREPSGKANGNTYDRRGRLLTCEHAASVVSRTDASGVRAVIASHYEGKELNSPNDVIVTRSGLIFFTDPNYGRSDHPLKVGEPRPQQLPWQGVFSLNDDDVLTPVAMDFEQPNGLCVNFDETMLFVNDTPRKHIRRWKLGANGGAEGGEVWAEVSGEGAGVPDGMKVDSEGTLFCTGPGGIHAFSEEGVCLGVIYVPEKAANFTWGDPDLRSLYVTASTSIYRLRMKAPGIPLF